MARTVARIGEFAARPVQASMLARVRRIRHHRQDAACQLDVPQLSSASQWN
jgi:hypothetical protein